MNQADPQSQAASGLESARLRLRTDIQWIAYQDTGRWVALDPISNAYYYFSQLERQAALLFDGSRSVKEVFEAIARGSLKSNLSWAWIETFIQKLLRAQLIDTPPGQRISQLPSAAVQATFFKSLFANPLSIRIPLVRPQIDYPWAKVFANIVFSPKAISGVLMGLLIVSYLVVSKLLSRPQELLYDISKIQGDRWLILGCLLVAIKSIHELGHYLACVQLRVRCAEIGALILCFTPCLYCDTTESWKLPSRWQRAGIAAAGIYFEFWIALIGGIVFLNTQSGLLHILGGGMWIMCTIGTLVLNANPLFRYDGYFIVSDLLGAPNLGSQSSLALWQTLLRTLGGAKVDRQEYDLPVGFLATFALLSSIYRWFVLGSILLFLWHFLVPMGLGLYFLAIVGAMALGIVKGSAKGALSLASELFAPEPISKWKLSLFFFSILAVILGVFLVRLPNRTVHRGYTEYSSSTPLYAPEDGTIQSMSRWVDDPGFHFKQAGESILQIQSPAIELERIDLEQQYLQIATQVETYRQAQINDEALASEIPLLEQLRAEFAAKIELIDERIKKLNIASPKPGRFIPKSSWNQTGFRQGEPSRRWQPIATHSDISKRLRRGELVGWFADTEDKEAVVLVSAETLRCIDKQTQVWVLSDSCPGESIQAKISYYSTDPIAYFPSELTGDPMFVLSRDERGLWQADTPLYRVRLELLGDNTRIGRGGLCSACFELQGITLAERFWRFVSSQFKNT
jgi:putative peptide zinc metalloprotease protein